MKLITKNITLESVKKSKYWDLIASLVWNHYSEKRYQDESAIEMKEDWFGKALNGSTHSSKWDDPNYSEEGYVRTLNAIVIKFTRTDYVTYIYIHADGNIYCFGKYTDEEKNKKSPNYNYRNLDLTNWMIENNLIM